jgi:hypothetical protein
VLWFQVDAEVLEGWKLPEGTFSIGRNVLLGCSDSFVRFQPGRSGGGGGGGGFETITTTIGTVCLQVACIYNRIPKHG